MPLIDITMREGLSRETKDRLRHLLCEDMGALIGIDPKFIAVMFRELPGNDMCDQGSFTEVFLSEGRPAAFKDALAKFVAEDICLCTGWTSDKANILVHDLRHGSVAAGGRILNRSGTAAEAVMKSDK